MDAAADSASALTHVQPFRAALDHPLAFCSELAKVGGEHGGGDDGSGHRCKPERVVRGEYVLRERAMSGICTCATGIWPPRLRLAAPGARRPGRPNGCEAARSGSEDGDDVQGRKRRPQATRREDGRCTAIPSTLVSPLRAHRIYRSIQLAFGRPTSFAFAFRPSPCLPASLSLPTPASSSSLRSHRPRRRSVKVSGSSTLHMKHSG